MIVAGGDTACFGGNCGAGALRVGQQAQLAALGIGLQQFMAAGMRSAQQLPGQQDAGQQDTEQ